MANVSTDYWMKQTSTDCSSRLEHRIQQVQALLEKHHLEALIIDFPLDLYYLTGQVLSLGRLVIEPTQATLFVDGRYLEACQKNQTLHTLLTSDYTPESAFGRWWNLRGKRVGFDAHATSVAQGHALQALGAELVPLPSPISSLREIKDAEEIEKMRQAALLGSRGYDYVCQYLREGVTEKEVATALTLFWLQEGGEKLAFPPHIAFGEHTSQPHYQPSSSPLRLGDVVLIDIGVVLAHYHSDMTRTLSFGTPPEPIQEIYTIVYDAVQQALSLCRPGTLIRTVDRAAREWISQKGYGDSFMHGLGHGVGLEIHEPPRLRASGVDADRVLQEGMVVTIEPGIYLPRLGGVRLEDTILITKNGYENLTQRPLSATIPSLMV